MTTHPEAVAALREHAGQQYRAAVRDLTRYALLDMALKIKRAYPGAHYVVLEPSDQGDWMSFNSILLGSGFEVDYDEVMEQNRVPVDDLDSCAMDLWSESWDGLWAPYVATDLAGRWTDKTAYPVLDLDLIINTDGECARVIAERASKPA